MPLLTFMLRQGARSLLLFCIALAAIGSFYLAFFPSMSEMMSAKSEMMQAFSPELLKALGMEDLSSGPAYTQAAFLGMVGLIVLIGAGAVWSAQVTAAPEETGELELVLAHGVSRRRVLLERWTAVVLRIVVLGLAAAATIAVFDHWADLGIGASHLAAGIAAWCAFGLLCVTTGTAAGALAGRRAIASGAAVALGVLAYALNAVGAQSKDTEILLDLSPYSWAFRHEPLADGWDATGLALLLGASALLLVVAMLALSRRDIGR